MYKSIQQFEESGIENLEKIIEGFMKKPTDMAKFVYGVRDEVVNLGLSIIKETLEGCNQMLRDSGKRMQMWEVVRTDNKKLTTSLGAVSFEKTLFKNKKTGERAYLLDRILKIASHERLTEDAEAKLLEEAVQSSYKKAGEETSLCDDVSKETVKNRIHSLTFSDDTGETNVPKKVVDYLYIDADEDHVSLQFKEHKGDLEMGENHWKNNCVLAKLVYVYEGIEKVASKSKRNRLISPHYFSGVYDGDANAQLWDDVYNYLDRTYDLDKVKKIYLNADGGSWIKTGMKRIAGIVNVLDEFHLQKYMLKLTSHMLDSTEESRVELCKAIKSGTKENFKEVVKRIDKCAETESTHKRIADSAAYILSNWSAAKLRLSERQTVKGCSAEGHVSHVLSSRMSSRPMGWSRQGANKMSHLRAYYWNHGDMLELVRAQEQEVPVAVGAENDFLSCDELLRWEKRNHVKTGKYVESISHSVSLEIKKKLFFNEHIWGL